MIKHKHFKIISKWTEAQAQALKRLEQVLEPKSDLNTLNNNSYIQNHLQQENWHKLVLLIQTCIMMFKTH